jgi:hypothetical protein
VQVCQALKWIKILAQQLKPRIYNLGSDTNYNTPKENNNNPLENYHTILQQRSTWKQKHVIYIKHKIKSSMIT